MDKALVYGTRDSGFDPQWSRFLHFINTFLTSFQCFSWTLRQALPPPKKKKKRNLVAQILLYNDNTPPLVTNAIEFVFQFQSWQLMMRIESEYSG